jgi:hypothetical protein
MNVWICKAVEEDATNYGVLAYSFNPGSVANGGGASIDGIIAKYYVIGTNDPYYRPTLAHECGHSTYGVAPITLG